MIEICPKSDQQTGRFYLLYPPTTTLQSKAPFQSTPPRLRQLLCDFFWSSANS